MWSDNAATEDFLNFGVIASVIADTVKTNGDLPLSIGVSGAWGVGKSSTLELLAVELAKLEPKPLIVSFQPWRHQGQDNVRAAFAECIATAIKDAEGITPKIKKKAEAIIKRANLMRIAGYGLGGALTLATGLPIGGLVGRGVSAVTGMIDGDITAHDVAATKKVTGDAATQIASLFPEGEKGTHSPYENIQRICEDFGETLEQLNRRLIVLVDDLDRCLPETTIEALEAMRLYFFVKQTVFVIAADEEMLRLAVRKHFEVAGQTLDTKHLQSYYDKLIQLPFRIPSLSVSDIVVYMALLVIGQQQKLSATDRTAMRDELCKILRQTWSGARVTRQTIMDASKNYEMDADFERRILMIERLAPLLIASKHIGGNPRLVKRFMNSLSVRRSLAKKLQLPAATNEQVLAKILLLQRCGTPELVRSLEADVNKSIGGKSDLLSALEKTKEISPSNAGDAKPEKETISTAGDPKTIELWGSDFAKSWLELEPMLANIDLRPSFHVSRGADEVFLQAIVLSPDSTSLLEALIANPGTVRQFEKQIKAVPTDEAANIMSALVERLVSADGDEVLDRLKCCVAFADSHVDQQPLLVSTLIDRDKSWWSPQYVIAIRGKPHFEHVEQHLRTTLPANHRVIRAMGRK